jgi:RHS repeat-associated protein
VVDQRWIEGSGGSATDTDRYTYRFDRNSNRTARLNQLDAAFSETYAFDGVDRLVDYARGGGGSGPQDQQWNLDALGNWTTITSDGTPESRTHNSQNELTGVGATPLAYDANGNMIQDEAGRQLQYNAWNRLVRVSLSGDQVAAYQYNGFQHRIVTIVGNGPSAIARDLFYSAGWQVLEQRIRAGGSLGNVAEEQFVWSVAYIDGLILRDRNADLTNATGVNGLEERVYALQDALWNTTALVDVNGNVLDRFAYSPYGVVETLNSNWAPTGSPSIPWAVLFRGYFADEGTGLLHARARQYSPTLGRFVSRDPWKLEADKQTAGDGYHDGHSLYQGYFVPNHNDPSGMDTKNWCCPGGKWTVEIGYATMGNVGLLLSYNVLRVSLNLICDSDRNATANIVGWMAGAGFGSGVSFGGSAVVGWAWDAPCTYNLKGAAGGNLAWGRVPPGIQIWAAQIVTSGGAQYVIGSVGGGIFKPTWPPNAGWSFLGVFGRFSLNNSTGTMLCPE